MNTMTFAGVPQSYFCHLTSVLWADLLAINLFIAPGLSDTILDSD